MGHAIGIDIGGTFTDCVVVDGAGEITAGKAPTTPEDRSLGFFAAIESAAEVLGTGAPELLAEAELVVHGTTAGTNAILTRRGADVGLLTTAGHADVMYLMRGGGRSAGLPPERLLHLPSTGKPRPIVAKPMIAEIPERIDVDGDIVAPLDEEELAAAVRRLLDRGAEAFAISFLWAIVNDAHERRAAEIVAEIAPGAFVTRGSELTGHVGEYERTATAVMNAYVGPLMRDYLGAIDRGVTARGFTGTLLFAHCAGGAMGALAAAREPLRTVNSGPVAGLGGSRLLGARVGEPNLITADVGGTSVDVSIIEDGVPMARETSLLARYEVALPTLDITSIGAGGGSLAWIDASGRLEVGPQSAGADPGPACYGRGGTEPTITDADLLLGYLDPDLYLGGRMKLRVDLAEAAVGGLAERLGLGLHEAAAGIVRLMESKSADLLRRASTMRGFDPREFACLAFGGGGPVHMPRAAHEAGIPRVIVPVPRLAALWSAFGAATADVLHVHTAPLELSFDEDAGEIVATFERLEAEAREQLAGEGFGPDAVRLERLLTARYTQQVHSLELAVDFEPDAARIRAMRGTFDRRYEAIVGNGAAYRDGGTTVTGAVLRARGVVGVPELRFAAAAGEDAEGPSEERRAYWDELGDFASTPVWTLDGAAPVAGRITGPALIQLPSTVIVVRPGMSGSFDSDGSFVLSFDQ